MAGNFFLTFLQNDIRRLRTLRSWFARAGLAVQKRRLEPTRALMDLHSYKSPEELLNYDPTLQKYHWVLVTKLK
jgi:hypothetical protein